MKKLGQARECRISEPALRPFQNGFDIESFVAHDHFAVIEHIFADELNVAPRKEAYFWAFDVQILPNCLINYAAMISRRRSSRRCSSGRRSSRGWYVMRIEVGFDGWDVMCARGRDW